MTRTDRAELSDRIAAACGLITRGETTHALEVLRVVRLDIAPLPLTPEQWLTRCPIGCTRVALCVARQEENDKKRPSRMAELNFRRDLGEYVSDVPRKRGRFRAYPNCVSSTCAVGAKIRALTQIGGGTHKP